MYRCSWWLENSFYCGSEWDDGLTYRWKVQAFSRSAKKNTNSRLLTLTLYNQMMFL